MWLSNSHADPVGEKVYPIENVSVASMAAAWLYGRYKIGISRDLFIQAGGRQAVATRGTGGRCEAWDSWSLEAKGRRTRTKGRVTLVRRPTSQLLKPRSHFLSDFRCRDPQGIPRISRPVKIVVYVIIL